MLKRIWMPFLALAIVSCSSEIGEDHEKTVFPTAGVETGYTLRQFTEEHLRLCKETFLILDKETNKKDLIEYTTMSTPVGLDTTIAQINAAQTTPQFVSILVSSGMDTANASTLVDLSVQQAANLNKFVIANPTFKSLSLADQEALISKEVSDLLVANPNYLFTDEDLTTNVHPCDRNKRIRLKDCFTDYAISVGIGAIGAIWSGGLSLAAAGLVGAVVAEVCYKRVIRDWHNCLDDAGIGIH